MKIRVDTPNFSLMLPHEFQTDDSVCMPVAYASCLGIPYREARALFASFQPGINHGSGTLPATISRIIEYTESAGLLPRLSWFCSPSSKARVADVAAHLPAGDYVFLMRTHAFHLRVVSPLSAVVTAENEIWVTRTKIENVLKAIR